MLKLIARFLTSLMPEPIDPAAFNDPVALTTAWTPLNHGGNQYKTHRLIQISPERVEFRGTYRVLLNNILKVLILIVVTLFAFGFTSVILKSAWSPAVLLVGAGLIYSATKSTSQDLVPVIFDKNAGLFWYGADTSKGLPLDEIHAIQLLDERIRRDRASFRSYELNLIHKNGQRTLVVDHGKLNEVRDQAARLAIFLGVPVWNVVGKRWYPPDKLQRFQRQSGSAR